MYICINIFTHTHTHITYNVYYCKYIRNESFGTIGSQRLTRAQQITMSLSQMVVSLSLSCLINATGRIPFN